MATDSIELSEILPAPPGRVYRAWLDGREHSLMTGGRASVQPGIGGAFSAWDGYIEGTTVALDPDARIVQMWRTAEFPDDSPDSRLELRLEPIEEGTRVRLVQTGIPEGQGAKYEDGWRASYFVPMRRYFHAAPAVPSSAEEEALGAPDRDDTAIEASERGAIAVSGRAPEDDERLRRERAARAEAEAPRGPRLQAVVAKGTRARAATSKPRTAAKRAAAGKRGATAKRATAGKRGATVKRRATPKRAAAGKRGATLKRAAAGKRTALAKRRATPKRAAARKRTAARKGAPVRARVAAKKRGAAPRSRASSRRAAASTRGTTKRRPATKRARRR